MAGVDEAGRGPVLGPLVVACAITDDPPGLARLGVRDSKELSPAARERLAADLRGRLVALAIVVLEPDAIDSGRAHASLNEIEGDAFARAVAEATKSADIGELAALEADAADTSEERFQGMIAKGLARLAPALKVHRYAVEHKADSTYPSVSAASILAKVERDRRIREIAQRLGADIGSGYPSDPTTIAFLRDYIKSHQDLPAFARRSWEPAKELLKEAGVGVTRLESFDGGGTRGRRTGKGENHRDPADP